MVMKNEIESQLVSLREELNTFQSQLRDLEIQRDIAIKEAIEPLFQMHGVLEYNAYLEVRDNYFYIKRNKENQNDSRFYIDDLIYIRIEGPNIYKSFYSTSDSSMFEYERMVILGRVGELVLESGDDLTARYHNVSKAYSQLERAMNNNIYDTERSIRDKENQFRELEREEFIRLLWNGVEFSRETFVTLQLKFNRSTDLTYLEILNVKGKSAYIKYVDRYNNMAYHDTIRYSNILDFASSKSYRNAIQSTPKVKTEEVSF
jgi:hypothetical protein